MKQNLGFVRHFVLLVTPLVANLAIAPSQAATFAISEGEFSFTNFSQSPNGVKTNTDTNTIAIANRGKLDAVAKAQANFLTRSPEAFNSSLSSVVGSGRDYLGEAESAATVIGYFIVDANKSFSFDFSTDLMQTSIDNSQVENAISDGVISFALVDTDNESILDFFSLVGNITTPSEDDFIAYQKSDNVTVLNNPEPTSNFGGDRESAKASIQGSVQRYEANKTNLALVEVESHRVSVAQNPEIPEPTTVLSSLASGAFLVALKLRKKVGTCSR